MVSKPTLDVDWVKVEEAIDQIHKILYNDTNTLLEIDLIVNTIWTNATKDKILQLALSDIVGELRTEVKTQMKDILKDKPKKEQKAPGIG